VNSLWNYPRPTWTSDIQIDYNKEMNLIWFIVGGVVGFFLGRSKVSSGGLVSGSENLEEMHEKSQLALEERTESRKNRILKYIEKEMNHQEQLQHCNLGVEVVGVSREEIEKLLDVSDNTARKYLNELEDEGKVKQLEERGNNVTYILK